MPGTKKMYPSLVKPVLDRLVALMLIILCIPIFIFSALLLAINNQGGVFFFQKRAGKSQKIFSILKFKTMTHSESGESGVSRFGKIFRKLSLDELPQLFNVLRGEMSLVGPRPLLVEYLNYYNEYENTRHSVQPGITGWAQVHGRNVSDWKTRMDHDVFYVDHISFSLDFKILLLTFMQFFRFSQADFVDHDQETFIEYAKRR